MANIHTCLEQNNTNRLCFRNWEESDASLLYQYASNPKIAHGCGFPVHLSLSSCSEHQSVEGSLQVIRDVFLQNKYSFAIVLKETNTIIGMITIMLDRQEAEEEAELGLWLAEEYWGCGYMSEAVPAILNYAFDILNMSVIWYGYFSDNERSKKLQRKIGFVHEGAQENVKLKQVDRIVNRNISKMTRENWIRLKKEVNRITE